MLQGSTTRLRGFRPPLAARSVRGARHLDHGAAGVAVLGVCDPEPARRALRGARGRGLVVPDARAHRRGDRGRARRLGFTRRKAEYAVALARSDLDLDALACARDDEVRARITALRGLGPWTAEWFLARHLARPHAWPAGDLALRKAALSLYRVDVNELGPHLHPFQNLSAHYLLAGSLTP